MGFPIVGILKGVGRPFTVTLNFLRGKSAANDVENAIRVLKTAQLADSPSGVKITLEEALEVALWILRAWVRK